MPHLVSVTGANGFIASWLVKLLLEAGYHVRGIVRSPDDKQKNGHLMELKGAKERLIIVKGDILDYNSLFAAINGCDGVFHTACPVPGLDPPPSNPEVEMLDPAVKGTCNVLKACSDARIKRVVVTSSGAAVYIDPNRPKEAVVDESCWSNTDYCRESKLWYMLGKTLGEQEAWKYAKEKDLDMVVVCPALVLGPVLQSTMNSSSLVILHLLDGSGDSFENKIYGVVDVRDVALAHILVYATPTASGRYFCCNLVMEKKDMVETLKRHYPNYALPTKCLDGEHQGWELTNISTKKLQGLGLLYTPIEKTLAETVESFQKKGILP